MNKKQTDYKISNYILAWAVHAFSASGAFIGVLTLLKIYQQEYLYALWLMGITIFIDSIDGTFARMVHIKSVLPKIDGALLDNIIDYLNYVITPCFFLLIKPNMLPHEFAIYIVIAITITSTYQFCQAEAKTEDHFFKGFPCYWNLVVFYMFIFNTSMTMNAIILSTCCILIFVPIKYVYPSRIDYLTNSKNLKLLMHISTLIYGIVTVYLSIDYPNNNIFCLYISFGYIIMYLFLSLYRTFSPMKIIKSS